MKPALRRRRTVGMGRNTTPAFCAAGYRWCKRHGDWCREWLVPHGQWGPKVEVSRGKLEWIAIIDGREVLMRIYAHADIPFGAWDA